MKRLNFVFIIILLFCFTTFSHAGAYLKLGDIEGESKDHKHDNWIEILSMSSPELVVSAQINNDGQCGVALRSRGDTSLGDIVVVRELDKASPKLQEAACNEEYFSEAIIDLVSSKKKGKESYLRYTFSDLVITNYSIIPGANAAGDPIPMEKLTLNFERIKVDYRRETD